ncbi:unnamed protein product [Taenia asiatica]|uniref:Eukaryotic translation initiation factor 4B n=1 Tax=Taenia asiatica TaxID=60517 RepID=A0A0R3WAR9_TAEAS|nr:unnamed protein product [Taenia asiatica]
MSLEDFFNKKSRKKTKKTINAQELFEQITDGSLRQKPDPEKSVDELVVANSEDVGEWEPIVNDDIELDFSNIRINDLATIKVEEEQAAANNVNLASKSDDSKVVWGGKAKKGENLVGFLEFLKISSTFASLLRFLRRCRLFVASVSLEEPEKVEEKPAKSNVYVPLPLRSGRSNAQALPNLESTEEFPTLDAAAQEKSKKNTATELSDNSWVEVSRLTVSRRRDGPTFSGTSYASSNSYRDDASSNKHSSSGFRDSCSSRIGGSVSASGWARGEALKNRPASSVDPPILSKTSSWERKSTLGSGASKPYVIPQERNILSFTQENRFAQLDNS